VACGTYRNLMYLHSFTALLLNKDAKHHHLRTQQHIKKWLSTLFYSFGTDVIHETHFLLPPFQMPLAFFFCPFCPLVHTTHFLGNLHLAGLRGPQTHGCPHSPASE